MLEQKDCSDFLAGNALQSNVRYSKLDETAVMGAACRHEYPLLFLNLRHGERYYYYYCALVIIIATMHNGTQNLLLSIHASKAEREIPYSPYSANV